MTTKELVKVINNAKRIYNWIKPGKIVDVSIDNLSIYLDAGFARYSQPANTAEADDKENNMTVKELVVELEKLGFTEVKGMKRPDLLAKYEELTAEADDKE